MRAGLNATIVAAGLVTLAGAVGAEEYLAIGNLIDLTGPTALVGQEYGQGKIDAMNYINENGGINGKLLDFDTIDYSYIVPRAVAAYRKWSSQKKVVAIQGWGTADTEALIGFVAEDRIPYFSASYSGHLTDPTGKNPATSKPAPYNFFVGPSYSDGCRGLVQWATEDWKSRAQAAKPRYIHMGDNHPYPNAPKQACEQYATELGFEVLPAIGYTMTPGDFEAPCVSLKESGANYAFLANTSDANVALLKACQTVGTAVQFMANIWGYDENVMKAAGAAANGVVWVMGAAKWGDEVVGMELVRMISAMSDPKSVKYRAVHYLRGICSVYFMKEAIEWADANGGITGPNIKNAMYQKQDWVPAGLEGVCPPATWTAEDHRGVNKVLVYRGIVKDATDGTVANLMKSGAIGMEAVYTAEIPRKPEWLGY